MESLVDANRVKSGDVDDIQDLFSEFVRLVKAKDVFVNFDHEGQDMFLDHITFEVLGSDSKWSKLWNVVSQLLLLSHGQAAIERGFSVNKNTSVDSLSEHNLVSLRLVKDYIRSVGGLTNVEVTQALLNSAGSARQI